MLIGATLALIWQAGFTYGKVTATQVVAIPTADTNPEDRKKEPPNVEGEAAMASANAAIWQTVINVFGLIGLGGTVLYAKRAWHAARDSADADNEALAEARKALALSEETARRELRAYVTVHEISADPAAMPGERDGYRIQIYWKNGGQTPAKRAMGMVNWGAFDGDVPADFGFNFTQLFGGGPQTAGAQGIIITPCGKIVPWSEIKAAANGSKRIFIWSFVEYSDIFNEKRRRTEFAAEMKVRVVNHNWEIGFIPIWQFNAMDEECDDDPNKRHVEVSV